MANMLPLISIAPMMGYTDRHTRYLFRLLAKDIKLYTEMITMQALIYGDRKDLLKFSPEEKPLALQLGGHDPTLLSQCAVIGENEGYDEINLNVGCPSSRVRSGKFGACLMLEPTKVAECVAAMIAKTSLPVTIKCRIGVDDQDSYDALQKFIYINADAGCKTFIIHARKAWLAGLSPKQNREIPPLRYDIVKKIKKDFPHLYIIGNGGINSVAQIKEHLLTLDGVMIGRASYNDPYFLAEIQKNFFLSKNIFRFDIINQYLSYVQKLGQQQNIKMRVLLKPLCGLFKGQQYIATAWRKKLNQVMNDSDLLSALFDFAKQCHQ
jgi:tRNA-dihydrouridine synthase A